MNVRVLVFLGPKNTRLSTDLVLAMKALGDKADYIQIDAGGNNALDFHIAYYLGQLAVTEPASSLYVVSKDTGFDPLLRFIQKGMQKSIPKHGATCARVVAIDDLPFVKKPVSTKATKAQAMVAAPASKAAVQNTPLDPAQPEPPATKKPAAAKSAVSAKKKTAELVELVLTNLVKRKGALPRRVATLMSTIQSLCGPGYSDKEIEAVFARLVKLKHVQVEGDKVGYRLV